MKIPFRKRLVFAAALLAGSLPACCQSATADQHAASVETIQRGRNLLAGSVLREIDDPSSGKRWLLTHDPAHPEGPWRLVLSTSSSATEDSVASDDASKRVRSTADQRQHFVIHAGDALLVEEHTAVVDTVLEGVALGSAADGAEFMVRLRMGGKVVRVVALEKGRAAFVANTEGQR